MKKLYFRPVAEAFRTMKAEADKMLLVNFYCNIGDYRAAENAVLHPGSKA